MQDWVKNEDLLQTFWYRPWTWHNQLDVTKYSSPKNENRNHQGCSYVHKNDRNQPNSVTLSPKAMHIKPHWQISQYHKNSCTWWGKRCSAGAPHWPKQSLQIPAPHAWRGYHGEYVRQVPLASQEGLRHFFPDCDGVGSTLASLSHTILHRGTHTRGRTGSLARVTLNCSPNARNCNNPHLSCIMGSTEEHRCGQPNEAYRSSLGRTWGSECRGENSYRRLGNPLPCRPHR